MSKVKLNIWGREFDLDVIFDCYDDEKVTDFQKNILNEFINNTKPINNTLDSVKEYCLKDENLQGTDNIDNIFKYVIPRSIYIERKETKGTVVLLCDYKFDPEHGLAVVFENMVFKEVTTESDVF